MRSPRIAARPAQIALAVLLAVLAIVHLYVYILVYSRYASDDAYIHLRIARNFVAHGHPYYNVDQAVGGSSSLFWTLLLSALFEPSGPTPGVLPAIEFICTTGAFLLCAWLLTERLPLAAAVGAAWLTVCMFLTNIAAGGMETPAALVFFLASLVAFRRGAVAWLGFWAAMAFLVRYEFSVWLALSLVLTPGYTAKTRYIRGAALPLLLFVGFNLAYFGTLVPQTVWAKAKVYQLSTREFLSTLELTPERSILFVLANGILLLQLARTQQPAWLRAAALFPLVLLGLYSIGRTMMFPWYLPLVFVPLMLAHLLALERRQLYVIALLLLALPSFPTASVKEAYGLFAGQPSLFRDYATGARVEQYLRIGADLADQFPQATLMSSEIGGLGWTFPGRIIDAAGLVSPECLQYHPMRVPEERSSGTLGAIPPQAVQDLAPDLVVSMEAFSEAFRRAVAAGHIDNYVLFRSYPIISERESAASGIHVVWGSRSAQVFARR